MSPPLDRIRRGAVLAAPVAVPVTMSGAFAILARVLPPRRAYNAGFALYWAAWCVGFPLWALGPRRCLKVLVCGRGPSAGEIAALLLPVLGGAGTELLPHRGLVDRRTATMMVTSAAVNAVGEELLWRGVFLEAFGDDVLRGCLWPLAGFTAWHIAPQIVLPSRLGRGRFLAGAAMVGAASALVAWRTRGLRATVLPHLATDACGVTAARFRLGLTDAPAHRRS
jgi:membrane protease YdiL (CAAX protease family)